MTNSKQVNKVWWAKHLTLQMLLMEYKASCKMGQNMIIELCTVKSRGKASAVCDQ